MQFNSILFYICVFSALTCFADLNSDQAMSVVSKTTQDKYQLSIWAGMHSWETVDLNNDNLKDFVALIKDSKNKKSENPPTHILIIHGQKNEKDFSLSKDQVIIPLNSGTPSDTEDSFTVVTQKTNKAIFKTIGCASSSAIKLTEEASTAFYLCWKKNKYEFLRDPEDTP